MRPLKCKVVRNARGSNEIPTWPRTGSAVGSDPRGSLRVASRMGQKKIGPGVLFHRIRRRIRIHGSDDGSDADPWQIDGVFDPTEPPSPLLYIILIKEGMADPTRVSARAWLGPAGDLLCTSP